MPIIATCPYCRAGAVRAPEAAVGRVAACPKCKCSFTVVSDERLPGRSSALSPPVDETRPHALAADVTEPSPVLPQSPPASPAPAKASPRSIEPAAPGFSTALVAVTLFGLAMVATQFPYGRISGLALAVLGLVLGLLALKGEGTTWLAATGAMALNMLALAVLLFAPSWLGLEPWRHP